MYPVCVPQYAQNAISFAVRSGLMPFVARRAPSKSGVKEGVNRIKRYERAVQFNRSFDIALYT